MALPPVVAVEIGTSKTIALVGEMRDDGHVMITGMGEQTSVGVRKGEIIDFENAVAGVRLALEKAEENSSVSIRQVYLAISGGHIQSLVNRGVVPVGDKDGEIMDADIQQVMNVARALNLPPEREMLHTICQHFCIDDQERVVKPEGMVGARLSLDMLVLHGVRTRLHNAVRVVRSVPVDILDAAFSGLCSALSVLTPEQKQGGVVVIDLGGGITDYLVYNDGVVAAAGALGVGGDHITNDIALGFNIPTTQAENLKRESGQAFVDASTTSQRVSLAAEVGFQSRSVSLKALHMVINSRMDEILGMVRKRLEPEGILRRAGAGIVLTGGGARLRGVTALTEKVFGLPCTVGKPRNVSGLATATEGPQYATGAGLIHYAFKAMEERSGSTGLGYWLKGLFRR